MARHLRIIIADDEAEIRDHYCKVIKRLGHEVVAAVDNGTSLIEVCLNLHPDLIISDVRMPKLDGEQAIRTIWKQEPIPTILISAFQLPSNFPPIDVQVMWSYLRKPVKRQDFEAAIEATTTS